PRLRAPVKFGKNGLVPSFIRQVLPSIATSMTNLAASSDGSSLDRFAASTETPCLKNSVPIASVSAATVHFMRLMLPPVCWPAPGGVRLSAGGPYREGITDRKSTRLNSSHGSISYAV